MHIDKYLKGELYSSPDGSYQDEDPAQRMLVSQQRKVALAMVNWDKPIRKKGGGRPLRFVGRINNHIYPIVLAEQRDNGSEYLVMCEENGQHSCYGFVENVPEPRLVSCTNYYPKFKLNSNYTSRSFKEAMEERDNTTPGYNITVTEQDGQYTVKLVAWNMTVWEASEGD